jgi:hypothetical protein
VVTAAGIASLGAYRFHRISPHGTTSGVLGWLQGWAWWDGAWYEGIVRHGYSFRPGRMSSVAFFPGYPLAGRAVSVIVRDPLLALFVVSVGSGLAAAVLFHRWCGLCGLAPAEARLAVASLVVYPCAFYLMGVTYADGMFLALALAAFVLLEHDRPVAAGALALVATATRPLGVAVVVGLWLRALELRRSAPVPASGARRIRPADAGLLLAPLGLVAYCGYLGARFGRPFAFVQAEAGWKQAPGPATWLKVSWFREMARAPYLDPGHLHLVGNAVVAVVAIGLLPRVFRRFGPAYGVYTSVLVVGAALSTRDFIGMGRYVVPAFPLFAVVGIAAARDPDPRRARTLLLVGAVLLAVLAFVHGRGTLVS